MADTHETIADVVRKIRNEIAELRKVSPNVPSIAADWWEARADEIEAAHKRELSKNVSKDGADFGQLGGAAKLREALVKCREIALQWQADEAAGVAGTTDKPHSRSAAEAVVDMEFEINAALAAPPRNCDRFATIDEARKAHEEYRGDYIMRASNIFDFPMKFEAWLFAPATEKEGGNDGNE